MTPAFINPLPGVPAIESPFFAEIFAAMKPDAETRRIADELHERGFATIDFPDADFAQCAEAIKQSLEDRFDWHGWAPDAEDDEGPRIQDAWKFDANVKRLAANETIRTLLSTLYGRRAHPFQTLNFPVGTQQHFHTDSIHFSSVPERFMCGVWVALEDVDAENGPLVYYPGSHKWPVYVNEHVRTAGSDLRSVPDYTVMWRELVRIHGATPQRFFAKKGQALIWAANLLHGGDRQTDKSRTRWSQVTHYFFDDCAYYGPVFSEPFLGKIKFRRVVDIGTGEAVPNAYAGREIGADFIRATSDGRFLSREPTWRRLLPRWAGRR